LEEQRASRPLREQDQWDEHARFMDGLFDEGFLAMAGPPKTSGRKPGR
jgi:hypothetical protein